MKLSYIENFQRTLEIIKLMARDEGATLTEISNKTGIDRWTVHDMIDRLDELSPDGKGLRIEEYKSLEDRRKTIYRIPKDNLWTLTLPGMNLSDEEGLLLALMFNQSNIAPNMKNASESLKKKLNMFKNMHDYQIMSVFEAKKITTKKTQKIIISILDAIKNNECISLEYKPVRRKETEYFLLPLGVFKYEEGYYLAAQKLPDGEYRTFGLERALNKPRIYTPTAPLPDRVDYKKFFDDPFGPFGHGAEFEAELKFDSFQGFFALERNWPETVSITEEDDETVTMKVKTHTVSGIKKWILSFGSSVAVISPTWLRDEIKEEHIEAIQKMAETKSATLPE